MRYVPGSISNLFSSNAMTQLFEMLWGIFAYRIVKRKPSPMGILELDATLQIRLRTLSPCFPLCLDSHGSVGQLKPLLSQFVVRLTPNTI
jgi:hypothetical protein